jgi:hypothetical protein
MDHTEILSSWVYLNNTLRKATEDEAKSLLDAEKSGRKRATVLLRIYGRYNQLRGERERRELLTSEHAPKKGGKRSGE